jgi:hypothetical protein
MDARARGLDTAYDELTSMVNKLDYPGARAFNPLGPSVAGRRVIESKHSADVESMTESARLCEHSYSR